MSAPERKDITERLRLRSETHPPPTPSKPAEIKRMKTSIFIDPEVMDQVDAAFDTYNYENRDARVKKSAFFEEVIRAGLAHSDEVAETCRAIGRRSARNVR
jgi:hypothetical protein